MPIDLGATRSHTVFGVHHVLCKVFGRFLKTALLCGALVSPGYRTFAQDNSLPGTYRSDTDDLLTVEKISVLPFTDNMQGIYARPLEAHFISITENMHRWNYVPATNSGAILSPEELEAAPEKVMQVSQGLNADGVFASRITKGPNGVTIHLSFFLTKDGKLLSQAILKDHKVFNINDLKEQMQKLLSEILTRLPYAGRVLSREANRVTINLGRKDGLQQNQMLSVIQIIKAQRHPKFNFLVRTEKEIFGKIKILKAEETLSFGVIVTEKEKGAIQKNAKIGPLEFVTYSGNQTLSIEPTPEEALTARDDSEIAFGKDARTWVPQTPPTIGMVGGRLGLGRYNGNMNLSGGPALESSASIAPTFFVDGEIWVTPEFTFHAALHHSFWTSPDPRSGGRDLNHSVSYYEAGFGYTFRFGDYVWSPQVEPFLGYFSYKHFVDQVSPQAFTTMEYSGFKVGLRGTTPVGDTRVYGVGGHFSLAPLKPSMKESPVTSGASSNNNLVQFGVLGFQRVGERLKLQLNLDFEMYSTSFSGAGTRTAPSADSASHRHTTLSGGVYYMF